MPKWAPAAIVIVLLVVVCVAGWKLVGRSAPPTVDKDIAVRPGMYNFQDELRKGNVGRRRLPVDATPGAKP